MDDDSWGPYSQRNQAQFEQQRQIDEAARAEHAARERADRARQHEFEAAVGRDSSTSGGGRSRRSNTGPVANSALGGLVVLCAAGAVLVALAGKDVHGDGHRTTTRIDQFTTGGLQTQEDPIKQPVPIHGDLDIKNTEPELPPKIDKRVRYLAPNPEPWKSNLEPAILAPGPEPKVPDKEPEIEDDGLGECRDVLLAVAARLANGDTSDVEKELAQLEVALTRGRFRELSGAKDLVAVTRYYGADGLRVRGIARQRDSRDHEPAAKLYRRAVRAFRVVLKGPDVGGTALGSSLHAAAERRIVQLESALYAGYRRLAKLQPRVRSHRRYSSRHRKAAEAAFRELEKHHSLASLPDGRLVVDVAREEARSSLR